MSLKGWDENMPNISREEELNTSRSTGHWGQKSEHLMALMGSSSDLFRSNKGESMSNILSSGVEGSSGSSRPLLPSRSLLSTSIVSIVVSESGPGLAGSTFRNNNRATHEKNTKLQLSGENVALNSDAGLTSVKIHLPQTVSWYLWSASLVAVESAVWNKEDFFF